MKDRQYVVQWPVQPPAPMPPFPPPMPPMPPMPPRPPQASKSMSITALVCGILGMIGSYFPIIGYFSPVLSVLAIVFGARGMKIARQTNESQGLAIAGLVLGIVAVSFLVLAGLFIVLFFALIAAAV